VGVNVVDGYGCTECGAIAHNGVLDPLVCVVTVPESESPPTSESVVMDPWLALFECTPEIVLVATSAASFHVGSMKHRISTL
jgi:hypothetical protein